MTYKLEAVVKSISSPVVLVYNGEETEYTNGFEAYERLYDKYFLIRDIFTKNNKIYVVLVENKGMNNVMWCGEEQATFF